MKKFLALALSFIMIFAVSVPVFAADKTITANGSDTGKVTVDATGVTETYTITFPSEISLTWDTTSTADMSYKVEHKLKVGNTLTVKVSCDGTMSATDGGTDSLELVNDNTQAFTLPDPQTFTGTSASQLTPVANEMTYSIKSIDGKALGKYAATFTYEATLAPTAAP